MKIATNKILTDYDGSELKDPEGPLTVRRILRVYAGSYVPAGNNAAEKAVIAHAAALKIHAGRDWVELTAEETAVVKAALAVPRHPAVIYAQVKMAFDAADQETGKREVGSDLWKETGIGESGSGG